MSPSKAISVSFASRQSFYDPFQDALDAILPFDRRDHLAALLTDDDVATLKHLVQEGMGENTLRALAPDLGYLEARCQLATGAPLPWPAPES